ncbi:LysM peptidoglycan-binding domain-containing protein [Paenibacillus elgii]|uniref:LysM peptidoglycan-binding domain-containing protein n=1 Tax=Paenibacillus elgii TaxID=189691 RepID=UPI000248D3DA|nr:LysM domain-containing protein [Paenibacillus elgii]
MIEFWLSFNSGEEKLWLPVPPESFEMVAGNQNTTVTINEIGEINLIGRRKLKTVTISSYFPIQDDGLCQYRNPPKPSECLDMIGRWRNSGKPIRLLIVGEGLKINEAMAIESFTVGQKFGPQDVYYTLELKEYRFLKEHLEADKVSSVQQYAALFGESRPTYRTPLPAYVVREGDTLITIAKSQYGDDSRWKEIQTDNNIRDFGALVMGSTLRLRNR